jgi:hypothetical protein
MRTTRPQAAGGTAPVGTVAGGAARSAGRRGGPQRAQRHEARGAPPPPPLHQAAAAGGEAAPSSSGRSASGQGASTSGCGGGVSRRAAVALPPLALAGAWQLGAARPARASKLGGAVDSAWEVRGTGARGRPDAGGGCGPTAAGRRISRLCRTALFEPRQPGARRAPPRRAPPPTPQPRHPALPPTPRQALGGGPADLFFPDQFLGTWDVVRAERSCVCSRRGRVRRRPARQPRGLGAAVAVAPSLPPAAQTRRLPTSATARRNCCRCQVSTLVKIETPLGEDKVPNPAALQRAREADLNKPNGYQVRVWRSPRELGGTPSAA